MTLSHIDNDDQFLNSEFKPSTTKSNTLSPNEQKKQIDQDYLLALCIEEEEKKNAMQLAECDEYYDQTEANTLIDEELARRLQEEEDLKEAEEIERNKQQQRMKASRNYQMIEQDSNIRGQQFRNNKIRDPYGDHQQLNQNQFNQNQFNQDQFNQLNHRTNRDNTSSNNEYSRNNKRTTGDSQVNLSTSSENHTQSSSSRHNRSNSNHHGHSKSKVSSKFRKKQFSILNLKKIQTNFYLFKSVYYLINGI